MNFLLVRLIGRNVNRLSPASKELLWLKRELSSSAYLHQKLACGLSSTLLLNSNHLSWPNSNPNSVRLNFHTSQIQHNAKPEDAAKNNPIYTVDQEDEERDKERKRLRQRQVKATKWTLAVFCGMFLGAAVYVLIYWGMPKQDEEGNPIIDRFSDYPLYKQAVLRAYNELINVKEDFAGPSRELLLPPPLTYPYMQPPYTLVIELRHLLVLFDWDYQSGWSCKTRPYLKKFLEQVGPPTFEIVIFTEMQPFTAFSVLEAIDKEGYIMHRLFKDSTRFIKGKHVKDLNILNRDLSKTIQIEVDRDACSLNQRNCLVLEKWTGDTTDRTLLDLAVFLKTIASQNVDDVREIITHYSQFDRPLEVFKQNQQRVAEEEERRLHRPPPLTSLVKKRI